MAFVLIDILRRDAFRNQRLKFYLIAYGVFRFLTEFIRPEPIYALGLTYFQWVALVAIIGLAVQWWYDVRQMNEAYLARARVYPGRASLHLEDADVCSRVN
jgi:prolipoprotein diacylglyceryltransferase